MSDYEPDRSPSDDVVDYVVADRRIKDPNNVVGFCSECKSEQPNQYMERNVFAQEGKPVPCKYCGGIVVIMYKELIDEHFKDMLDVNRGIGSSAPEEGTG